jgi:SAM-dependent methyltransferase
LTAKRALAERFYAESAFGGFTRVDGTMAFYLRVNALLTPRSTVLDVGCGRGEYADDPIESRVRLRTLRGKCARVIGIDADTGAAANPFVDEFRLVRSRRWPVETESVDLCLADNVVEHVSDPDAFFAECRRVTRPGGFVCVRTPNSLGYATVAARLIPNPLHAAVLRRIQPARHSHDVFRTYYRCNSARRLSQTLTRNGFLAAVYAQGVEPAYLNISPALYAAGVLWAAKAPEALQSTLFAFARKANRLSSCDGET